MNREEMTLLGFEFVMDLSLVCQSSFSHLSLSLLPMSQMLGDSTGQKTLRPS